MKERTVSQRRNKDNLLPWRGTEIMVMIPVGEEEEVNGEDQDSDS